MKGWVFSDTAEHSLSQSAKQLEIHTWKNQSEKHKAGELRHLLTERKIGSTRHVSVTCSGHREQEELEWVGGQCAGPGLGTAQLEN